MASKPKKYPRKLRQTLERVAQARDERQVAENRDRFAGADGPDDPNFGEPFYRAFIPEESVAVMYARIDERHRKMVVEAVMYPPPEPEMVQIRAPWLSRETDTST